ncbi:hypothetical protein [Fodinibius salsisoli]|uniref:Uncharacterized protein n=1 Tax=Fodinibius salsisoli TaxID=2820877 RepID=A0ABT3PS52_9BACT|nr:hypothetical protein [Fodinibius salsisoli]MCW9708676.1 hypothetical protein [Fodinibius salsisoli]
MRQYPMHSHLFSYTFKLLLVISCISIISACGSSRPYTQQPVKTFDPDNKNIPRPAETEEHFQWETLYLSTFYQLEKTLDLGSIFQAVGHAMGINGMDEADNVNVLDEVPNSSWYTRRHYFKPMSLNELKRGPISGAGPDTTQPITVIRGKSEGVTPGFTVQDARGNTYIIKLDRKESPELMSSSEVIVTNIYHAAGYSVPENSISYFDPDQLVIAEDATVTKGGDEKPMTKADLQEILDKAQIREDGKVRVLASKYVNGRPLGPWNFKGTRKDDPNDRIPHEDRREVRGLRVLGSWVNDTDRRHGNTMAVYVGKGDKGYIEHYLLDMGSTLGTVGVSLRHTKRGQEYRYDPRYMGVLYGTLGLYVKPWARPEAKDRPFYPSVGYFESKLFSPANWVTSYPNPAFEKVTPRDGLWGAKMVMAFSDEEIRALVELGKITNPEAKEYLVQTLIERRDKIGNYWFSKVNPLDKFKAMLAGNNLIVSFADLGVEGGLFEAANTSYRYKLGDPDQWISKELLSRKSSIAIDLASTDLEKLEGEEVIRIQLHTLRNGKPYPDKKTDVYIEMKDDRARVVGIKREG